MAEMPLDMTLALAPEATGPELQTAWIPLTATAAGPCDRCPRGIAAGGDYWLRADVVAATGRGVTLAYLCRRCRYEEAGTDG